MADPGRFERPRPQRGVGRPDTASQFTLEHPQRGMLLEERIDAWRIEATNNDRPAGVRKKDYRPSAHTSDPSIFAHKEAPEAPPRPPSARASHIAANMRFVREVENVVSASGIVGHPALTTAVKQAFGGKENGLRRPPSAPSQMLVGKPQQSKAPPTPRPATATTARPSTSATARSPQAKVPSRTVSRPASARSSAARIDFMNINKRNAALTPRRVEPAPPPSAWKMARFGGVAGKSLVAARVRSA